MLEKLKCFARSMKQQITILFVASRDSRTPLSAKAIAILVVAYAVSPIDLIPDFIPVLGYLDDLLLLPIGIYFAIQLIPTELWHEFQLQVQQNNKLNIPKSWTAAIIIGLIWTISLVGLGIFLLKIYP